MGSKGKRLDRPSGAAEIQRAIPQKLRCRNSAQKRPARWSSSGPGQLAEGDKAQAQRNALARAKAENPVTRLRQAGQHALRKRQGDRAAGRFEPEQASAARTRLLRAVPARFQVTDADGRQFLGTEGHIVKHESVAAAADADRGRRELHRDKMDCRRRLRQPAPATKERAMPNPADLTARRAAALIQSGDMHPEALADACLARIEAREGIVHAMAAFDPAAIRTARYKPGPLHGLPLGVKDVLDTADLPSEYGSPIWAGHRPRVDAACVAVARRAGALVMGKTVTTEFATRHAGPTTNPHDPARTPGGSSSGSAAGVAAGYFPFAFGTQTAGSVVRPAAYCGVVGYKPSFGLIRRAGMKLMADSLDTIGVMARSVGDCAMLAEATSGVDLGDPEIMAPHAPRLGLCRTPLWDRAAPETVALLERAESSLARAGAAMQSFTLPPIFNAFEDAHAVVMHAESARSLGWELTHHRDMLSPGLRERMEWGLAQPADALARAQALLQDAADAFGQAMAEAGLDALITPAAPGIAPLGLEWTGDAAFNLIWTGIHAPCITVPAGAGPEGMPLGLQVVAPRGQDRTLLAWAEWVRSALG